MVKPGCLPAVLALTAALWALGRADGYADDPLATTVLFNREVIRIFHKKCLPCHASGTLAMSLATHGDARPWGRAIKEEILERRMPPWQALRGYGVFANDIGLTEREITLIVSWVDGGMPSGDRRWLVAPEVSAAGGERGIPDLVRAVTPVQTIEANGAHDIRRVTVDTGLSLTRWVRAIEFRPGDRRVVRSAFFYVEQTGQWLGSWTPWQRMVAPPEGAAYRLPARSRIVAEIHYQGCDETVTDRSTLGLYFSDARPDRPLVDLVVQAPPVDVPARAARHRIQARATVPREAFAWALRPEMTAGARSVEVTALRPDGAIEVLLWVNDYRVDWQVPYVVRDPVLLPRGTKIVLTAYYDNPRAEPVKERARLTVSLTSTARGASPAWH